MRFEALEQAVAGVVGGRNAGSALGRHRIRSKPVSNEPGTSSWPVGW